jgi:hypothetical protein
MLALSVVVTFNILENIPRCFLARAVPFPVYQLNLKRVEKLSATALSGRDWLAVITPRGDMIKTIRRLKS